MLFSPICKTMLELKASLVLACRKLLFRDHHVHQANSFRVAMMRLEVEAKKPALSPYS